MRMGYEFRPQVLLRLQILTVGDYYHSMGRSTDSQAAMWHQDRMANVGQSEETRPCCARNTAVFVAYGRLEEHGTEPLVGLESCHAFPRQGELAVHFHLVGYVSQSPEQLEAMMRLLTADFVTRSSL